MAVKVLHLRGEAFIPNMGRPPQDPVPLTGGSPSTLLCTPPSSYRLTVQRHTPLCLFVRLILPLCTCDAGTGEVRLASAGSEGPAVCSMHITDILFGFSDTGRLLVFTGWTLSVEPSRAQQSFLGILSGCRRFESESERASPLPCDGQLT